jgi:hypothetical protein
VDHPVAVAAQARTEIQFPSQYSRLYRRDCLSDTQRLCCSVNVVSNEYVGVDVATNLTATCLKQVQDRLITLLHLTVVSLARSYRQFATSSYPMQFRVAVAAQTVALSQLQLQLLGSRLDREDRGQTEQLGSSVSVMGV